MLTPDPVQTAYTRYETAAQNGTPATMSGWDVDSKICESATIGFGLAVCQGVADRGVLLGSVSGRKFVGITRADPTLVHPDPAQVDKYVLGENVAVAVKGDWWVVVVNTVHAGDTVLFDDTTGQLGKNGGDLIEDARWMTSASAGGLAVVRLGNAAGAR